MAIYSQELKVQSVEKALSNRDGQTHNNMADDLRIGYSTLQRWVRLAKENKPENPETHMSIEKSRTIEQPYLLCHKKSKPLLKGLKQ